MSALEVVMDRQRLARIFDIIRYLSAHGPSTVTEISTALAIPLSSSHDLLRAMVDINLIHMTDRTYDLGSRTIRTALAVMDRVAVKQLASRHLENLVEKIGFDVYLAMSTGNRVIYVSRFRGRQRLNLDLELGGSLLLHSTAVGKLFAAFDHHIYEAMMSKPRPRVTPTTRTDAAELDRDLATIRRKHFSISRGESITGIIGLATPVMAADGSIAAAVHVSALRTALPARQVTLVVRHMSATCEAIKNEVVGGYRAPEGSSG